jgi:phosphosulfolactate synthase
MVDSAGGLIDVVKLGFGTSYVMNRLKEKIALYKSAQIRVYLGGTLFEAFIARGQFKEYRKLVEELDWMRRK